MGCQSAEDNPRHVDNEVNFVDEVCIALPYLQSMSPVDLVFGHGSLPDSKRLLASTVPVVVLWEIA